MAGALALVSALGVMALVASYRALARRRARGLRSFTRHKLPQRIILIRHGESLGNLDDSVYSRVPDWRVRLSPNGHQQAIAAGRALRQLIESEPCVFYVSPYYRARETFANIALQLEPEQVRDVRLEPRLREQDWGNYQRAECMRTAKQERGLFGRFFYRFPNGESGADVYDRVSTFLETLARDILSDVLDGDTNAVIVSHGLTIRLFLMRWFKWPVELFEGTDNPGNAQTLVMERKPDGTGYELTADSLAIIGLGLPAGANHPTLLARQFAHLRRSLGESAGFCEFASANAALRARERDGARRPSVERAVRLERCASKDVTAEDVACAERRAVLLASSAIRVAPLADASERVDAAAPPLGREPPGVAHGGRQATAEPAAAGEREHEHGNASDGSVSTDSLGETEAEAAAAEHHRQLFLRMPRRPTLAMLHSSGGQTRGTSFSTLERSSSDARARPAEGAAAGARAICDRGRASAASSLGWSESRPNSAAGEKRAPR